MLTAFTAVAQLIRRTSRRSWARWRRVDAPVYQFCAFVDPADQGIVTDVLSHSTTTRWCDLFCDIIPANGGKDLGVAATLERLGIDASEAIAFGDGENDL